MSGKRREKAITKEQKTTALAMLAVGTSRQSASRSIGCSADAIDRLVRADSNFAKEVRKAEDEAEMFFINRIREAAKDNQTWRAAAWMLERRNPERYGYTKAGIITKASVERFMRELIVILVEEVPDKAVRERVFDRFEHLLGKLEEK